VDKAGRRVGLESGGRCLVGGEAGAEIVPRQAAVDSAARQLRVDAAAHRFDDVVERQRETAPQFDDQRFLPIGDHGGQAMRAGGAVGDVLAGSPARHGAAMNAEFAGQRLSRQGAVLDISARARRRGGVGVQSQMHQQALPAVGLWQRRCCVAETLAPVGPQGPPTRRAARRVTVAPRARGSLLWTTGTSCAVAGISRSRKKQTACHNRALSRQSSETKHLRRGDPKRDAADF